MSDIKLIYLLICGKLKFAFLLEEAFLLSTRVRLAWSLVVVVLVLALAFYIPFWSFNKNTMTSASGSPIEVARSKQTVTTLYPQYNNNPNHYLIQTKHFKLFNFYKVNYEHNFINNPTQAISYNTNIIDGTQAKNSFIAVINDTEIKHVTYTDHVGAQGVLGLIESDGTISMSSSHDITQYPQLIYVNGGFKNGTITGMDERGHIVIEEHIVLE